MDTQLLQAFIQVAQSSSFSQAAQVLGLTQSAVSKRIALLEQQLSQTLFDRIGRSIYLTEAGQTLLPRAENIINALADAKRLMEQQHDSVKGPLRLATSHHIGIHRLPPYLESYTKQYPEVHLQLQFIDSEQAIGAIERGEFDLAIITLPDTQPLLDDSTIQQHILWDDPMKIVTHRNHPLQHKSNISLNALAQFPAILPDATTQTTRLVSQLFRQNQLNLSLSMTTNHLDAIKMMVGIGLGWSALPERLIDKSIRPLSLKNIALIRHLGCIHHRKKTLTNAARAMLHCLQSNNS